MAIEIIFAPGTVNETTVDLSKRGTRLNPVRTHTGVSDVRGTIAGDRSLEQYAQRQDRINIKSDGETIWTGYCIGISHDKSNGETQIQGDGIGKRLEETRPDYDSIGGAVTYSNIALHDAIRDYWGRTEFGNYTVTDQETELVAEDEVVQSVDTTTEWDNRVDIGDTEPFKVENGAFSISQTCAVQEAYTTSNNQSITSNNNYSDGLALILDSSGDVANYSGTFELHHTIPENDVHVSCRLASDGVGLTISIVDDDSGSVVGSVGRIEGTTAGDENDPGWEFDSSVAIDDWTDGDLEAGTYRFRLEATNNGDDYGAYVDLISVYDGRYHSESEFDETLNEPGGHLTGPNLYPSAGETIAFVSTTLSYNVTAAHLTSQIDNLDDPQQIRVSNNAGDDFISSNNSETIDVEFPGAGREMVVGARLGAYGTRTDATPLEGFQGQSTDSYNLEIDGDNLVVLVDMELTRNHFDNLKKLHNFGDFVWVIEHDDGPISDMAVSSFRRGTVSRPKPDGFDNQTNQTPEIQSGAYYNSIYLEGALQEDGTRPTAEVKEQDAIDRDGREISPGVLRDTSVTTDAGVIFRVQALLDAAQSNNDLVGSVTVPPMMVHPGYTRPVDFGNGEQQKTAEEIQLNISQSSADATFNFSTRKGLVEDINSLRQNSKDQGNQV